jgi:uracil-DNA glycosylase
MNKINQGWIEFFDNNREEFNEILDFLDQEKDIILPYKNNVFKALFYFPPEEIKLVILGQDPYISYEKVNNVMIPQACGLAFSVPKEHKKIPKSLQNIFKEIKNCYPDYEIPKHGSLKSWVKEEKILLLNTSLTVIENKSNSHVKLWEHFTNQLIKYISDKNEKTIFLLMGSFAGLKEKFIDTTKHKIFKTVHPSPLSASRGFFGCKIFLKINEYLKSINKEPIHW